MKKDISPEMYNYNKFPGPQFVTFSDRVKSENSEFLILENEKDAFDVVVFSQRFSEILLKYDYIVGDWGNEQLRLKGFYRDDKSENTSNHISRLEDYIKEYCNFGCAYFVLENLNPKEQSNHFKSAKRHKTPQPYLQKKSDDLTNRSFTSQKRKEKVTVKHQQKHKQEKDKQSQKQHFVIVRKTK